MEHHHGTANHSHSHSHLTHHFKLTKLTFFLVVAVLYSLFVFFYVLQHIDSEAATSPDTIASLTTDLNTAIAAVPQVAATAKVVVPDNVTKLAVKRRDLLVNQLKSDPKTFLLTTLPKYPVTDVYPRLKVVLQDKGYVEKPLTLQGKLSMQHIDTTVGSTVSYKLITLSGTDKVYTQIYAAGDLAPRYNALDVKVTGMSVRSYLAFSPTGVTVQPTTSGISLQSIKVSPTTGNRKLLVILFNFTNNTTTPYQPADVESKLFAGVPGSLDYYTKEVSYGQLSIAKSNGSKVVGWYTIPSDDTDCWTNNNSWADKADVVAKQNGVDVDSFDYVAYVMPATAHCSTNNTGGRGSPGGWAFVGANRMWINGLNTVNVFGHEFGHNLGLMHAASLKCGTKTIDTFTNCTESEYGNPFDAMGTAIHSHYNAIYKSVSPPPYTLGTGWIKPALVKVVTPLLNTTTQVTLAPQELVSSTLPQLLQVNAPNGMVYYVEYRRLVGVDTILSSVASLSSGDPGFGLLYHYQPSVSYFARLLDLTPGDNTFSNSYFRDGVTFIDQATDLRISQFSHDANSAVYKVSVGPFVRVTDAPTPTPQGVSPFQSVKVDFYNQQMQPFTLQANAYNEVNGLMGGACWGGSHNAGTASVEGRELGVHSILSYINDPVQGIDGACGFFFHPPTNYAILGVTPVPATGFVRTDNLRDPNYNNAIGSGLGWNPVKWTDSPRQLKIVVGPATATPVIQSPTAVPTSGGGRVTSTPVPPASSCNAFCQSDANCTTGYSCYAGFCRKPACSTSSTCGC